MRRYAHVIPASPNAPPALLRCKGPSHPPGARRLTPAPCPPFPRQVSAEDLGGADVHCRTSGVTDHYAVDEPHALRIARRMVGALSPSTYGADANGVGGGRLPRVPTVPPLFPQSELRGLVPADPRQPLPIRKVCWRHARCTP